MTATQHLGDCVEFMRTLPDKSVDHVIADPPYSEHVHGNARTNDKRAADKVHDIAFRAALRTASRKLDAKESLSTS